MYNCNEISIEIIDACAQRCIFCSSSSEFNNLNEIPLLKIKQLIDIGKDKMGTDTISLSGGEPLLHRNVDKIIEYVHEKRMRLLFYTSGITSTTRLGDKYFIKSNIPMTTMLNLVRYAKKIIFNIQGLEKTHDKLVGVNGSFGNILKLNKYLIQQNKYTEAHFVPMKMNYKELKELYNLLKNQRFKRLSLLRYVPQGRGDIEYMLTKKEFIELNKTMLELKQYDTELFDLRLGEPIDFTHLLDLKGLRQKTKHCTAGVDKLLIHFNGDIHLCPAQKNNPSLVIGNIYKDDIYNLWISSPIINKMREYIEYPYRNANEICKSCKYLYSCCTGCPSQSLLAFDNIYEIDNMCFKDLVQCDYEHYCVLKENGDCLKKYDEFRICPVNNKEMKK